MEWIEHQRKLEREQEAMKKEREEKERKQPYLDLLKEFPGKNHPFLYWLDEGQMFQVGVDNPYDNSCKKKAAKKVQQHRKKWRTVLVSWDSKYGDTSQLAEGESEYQEVFM